MALCLVLSGCDAGGKPNARLAALAAEQRQGEEVLARQQAEIVGLQDKVAEQQAELESVTRELVRVKVERDRLKLDVAALRRQGQRP